MLRRLAPALLVPVVLAGCSGSGEEATPSPSIVLPTYSASPTTEPSPTPTLSPTPSPTPTGDRRIPALDGDVDGDGTADSVRATAETLTVELSTGATLTAPVHAESPRSPAVLGYADVDRDGRSEVFLETAEGASTQFATPYRYDGKALRELQLDGGPARLGMGGSVTHGDGFRCGKALLEVLSSDSPDGATYTVHVDTYRLSTSDLLLVSSRTVKAKSGDELVEASYRPDCGSVGN